MSKTKKGAGKSSLVIGGGYTGMVAALRLAEAGRTVTLVERGNAFGGLASDFIVEGASLERAYHHLFKTDTSIRDLARELGIEQLLKWHESSVCIYYDGKLYPFRGAIDLLRFKPLGLVARIRTGMVVFYLQQTKAWQRLENISAYDWMLRYAGASSTKVIWEPLLRGKFDWHYKDVSMAWLWARIHVRAQSREAGGEKLGYFDGGFQVLTDALTERLKQAGVRLRNGVVIEGLDAGVSSKVTLSLEGGATETYDECVVTTPSYVFASLISKSKAVKASYLKQLNSIEYLGARLIIFSSDQDLTPYYWHNINDVDLPFLVFINHTRLIDKSVYGGKYVYYIAAYAPHNSDIFKCDDAELEQLWFKSLAGIFSTFDTSQIHEKHFFRFANAQHIADIGYSKKIPGHKTPLMNVYLANFSQIYPEDRGTNYAVRDGNAIAQQLLGD